MLTYIDRFSWYSQLPLSRELCSVVFKLFHVWVIFWIKLEPNKSDEDGLNWLGIVEWVLLEFVSILPQCIENIQDLFFTLIFQNDNILCIKFELFSQHRCILLSSLFSIVVDNWLEIVSLEVCINKDVGNCFHDLVASDGNAHPLEHTRSDNLNLCIATLESFENFGKFNYHVILIIKLFNQHESIKNELCIGSYTALRFSSEQKHEVLYIISLSKVWASS